MASLVSTTVNGDLKVTGSSNLFFEGSPSSNTFEPGTRIYGAAITLTGGAYTSVFEYTVPGGLAGNFRFFVKGTTGSVVIPTQVDVLLNHSKDITIKSQTGNYTPLHVKVLTNNNEDCLVQLKADTSGNANVTVYIDVIAFGDGSVSFSSFGSYTGTSLEHKCNFGFAFSTANNLTLANFVMDGSNSGGRLGIGTNVPMSKLHVFNDNIDTRGSNVDASTAQLYFDPTNGNGAGTSNTLGSGITWKPNYGGYSKRSAGVVQIGEGNYFRSGLAFYTNSTADHSTDWSERMRISMEGNVGIGTTNPSQKLHVNGNITVNSQVIFSSGSNQYLEIGTNSIALKNSGGTVLWNSATALDSSTAWANMGAGTRFNYTLKFQPPGSSYAGFQFMGTNSNNAGFFLIRGTNDTGVYTAEGITLVADQGWLTLAQRTTASKGVRIMTGSGASTSVHVRINVSTAGDIVLGVPTNSLAPATTTTLKGYSAQYDAGGAGERLSNTGFLTWHTGGSWTGSERMWSLTNAYHIGAGGTGPKFALLRGNNNTTVPTLGNAGSLGTNTSLSCYWTKDDVFHNAGPVSIVTQTLPTSNKFHVSSGSSGSASKSSIAVVSVADSSTFNNGVAALHVINSGNRGTTGNSIGSDLLRLEFSDGIHTIFNKDGSVGIGTTNPSGLLTVYQGELTLVSSASYNTHLNYQNGGSHYITMANGGATYFRGSSNSITTMTVLGSGSVGIGGSPSAALDIFAANSSSIAIRIVGGNKAQFLNAASNTNANIYNAGSSGNSDLTFQISGTSIYTMTSGSFYPVADGAKDLGLSGNRWNNVYSEAGNFSGNLTLAGNSTSRFYFGNKLAIEGQISNNNLDLGENFANIRLRSSSDVFPTNSVNLGTSANRWTTIYGAAGDFSGVVLAGSTSTTGGSWLEKNYTGANKINVLSSHYSNGNTVIGYGAKGKTSNSGYVATYGNFSGNKSVLEVAANAFYFKTTDSATQDTIGDDITLNQRLAVDKDGMTFTSSGGTGLIVNRTSVTGYLQFYPAYSNVPTIMGKGAGGLHLGYNSSSSGIRIDTSNNVIIKDNILFFGSTAGGFVYNDSSVMRLAGDGGIKLQTYVGGWQDRLTIIDNGNVGIGTTNPGYKLDVGGTLRTTGQATFNTGATISNNQNLNIGTTGSNTGYVRFYNNNATAYYIDWESTGSRAYRFHGTNSGGAFTTTFSQAGTGGHNVVVSGTLTAGNISGNGSGLTSLNASNISSGTVAAARLGSGSSITTKFLRGDNTWQTVSSGSNPNNATITLSAGTNLSGGGNFTTNQSSNETITFNMSTGGAGAGTYGDTSNDRKIDTITLDAYGRVTAVAVGITGDILGVTAGSGLSGGGTSGTVTVSLGNAGAGAGTYGSTADNNKIDQITLDQYGRVTNITTGGTGSGSMSGWYWGVDSSTATYISNGETVRIKGGTNVTVSRSGNDVTINASGGGSSPNNSTITLSAGTGLSNGGAFTTNQSFNETITFNVDGTVCRGVSAPSGSATPSSGSFTFSQSGGMSISASGSTVTFSSSSASDYRLKKNVTDFNSESWTKVKSVSCRKFDFDAEKFAQAMEDDYTIQRPASYGGRIGFIAHELEAAGIDGAVEGEKDGVDENGVPIYQKVSYTTLVPVLWGALNEAIRKIEILESKVQALEDSS